MNRRWSRIGVRAASVGLLMTGVAGGVYLGQDRDVQAQAGTTNVTFEADEAEVDLLKERHAAHAAARAPQRKAEAEAAAKATTAAKAAASKARKLEKAAIAKKAAEKKAAEEAAKKAAEEKAAAESGGSPSAGGGYTGPIPGSCGAYSDERAIACAVLLDSGFGLDQMPCLDKLWQKESGWNEFAENKSSGAYGIPQALPGRKMASAGSDWRTNPATQVKWGLGYIKGRYGTPCGAWGHSQRRGWY